MPLEYLEKSWARIWNDEGKVFILFRALYGLKSSGPLFRPFIAERLDNTGFKSSIADPNFWMREATNNDGEEYYEYILVYIDNLIVISLDAVLVILEVAEKFRLRKDKIEPPEIYIDVRLAKKSFNREKIGNMSSVNYVK